MQKSPQQMFEEYQLKINHVIRQLEDAPYNTRVAGALTELRGLKKSMTANGPQSFDDYPRATNRVIGQLEDAPTSSQISGALSEPRTMKKSLEKGAVSA